MKDFLYNAFVVSFQQGWWLFKNNFSFARRLLLFTFVLILIDIFLIFIHFWSFDYSLSLKISIVSVILLVSLIVFMLYLCDLIHRYADSVRIDKNIDSLPKEIKGHKVVIQYTPPKGLNPSEMGFLYYLTSDRELTKAILYKREAEGFIEISDDTNEHGKYTVKKVKDLNLNKVPIYEKNYWLITFGKMSHDEVFDLDYLIASSRSIQIKIEEYCVEKGRVIKKNFGIKEYKYIILILCYVLLGLFFVNIILALVCFFLFIVYFIYTPFVQLDYERTDEGNKLYAHIIGYKYYLEHCEEKQLLERLKEDSHHSKLLPTMIALKMDWKFLEKAYFQNDEISVK